MNDSSAISKDNIGDNQLFKMFNQLIIYIDELMNSGLKPFRIEYLLIQRNAIMNEINNLKL